MEPVTHFLTGACLGRAGCNRRSAYATLCMCLAAEAPDIDVVSSFGGPVTGFCHHRGITHTFLGAPFMALAVTGVVWLVTRALRVLGRKPPAQPVRWLWLYALALLADLSHLLLDFTNNYGLRPFFPFSSHWHAWSIVFIFDPLLFAMLVLGLALPALTRLIEGEMRGRAARGASIALPARTPAAAALLGICLLYALRSAEQLHALHLVASAGQTGQTGQSGSPAPEPLLRVAAMPSMADPFTWHTLSETATSYQLSTVHTTDDLLTPGPVVSKPPVTAAVRVAKASYLGRVYGNWSSWPVTEDLGEIAPPGDPVPLPPGAHTVRFRDLRFASQFPSQSGNDSDNTPLGAYAVIGSDNELLSQWMNGRQQH